MPDEERVPAAPTDAGGANGGSSSSSPGGALHGRPPRRKLSAATVVAIVVAVVVVGSGLGYATYSSYTSKSANTLASDPCAAYTPAQLGADAQIGNVSGVVSPDYAQATTVPNGPIKPVPNGTVIKVVAAENFWGSLVSQLGGSAVSVLSVVSDPNTDPHEYEANTTVAAELASANYVILNGDGYDDWATTILASQNQPGQEVLNVAVLNGVTVSGGIVTGNPHQWYNPLYVNRTLLAMYGDLVALQPQSTATFQQNWAYMNTTDGPSDGVSLDQLYSRANQIRADFAGTVVVATESIFVYLANYTGLDLIAPPAFMEAIAEGNDPPSQSTALFECQITSGYVKVLIYNIQTVTPITSYIEGLAETHNVTLTYVSETIQPPDTTFELWMYGEYNSLENALNAYELGQ